MEWDINTNCASVCNRKLLMAEEAQYGPTGFRWTLFFFVIIYDLYEWKAAGKVEYGIKKEKYKLP